MRDNVDDHLLVEVPFICDAWGKDEVRTEEDVDTMRARSNALARSATLTRTSEEEEDDEAVPVVFAAAAAAAAAAVAEVVLGAAAMLLLLAW